LDASMEHIRTEPRRVGHRVIFWSS
jgi:hypothetical protein